MSKVKTNRKRTSSRKVKKKGAAKEKRPKGREKNRSFASKKMVKKGKGVSRPKSVAITPTDPILQAYIREVNRHPLLSREEERELAIKFYKTKDRTAFQRLVTSNLRFVIKIAYEYIHYRLKLLDLIQEGNIGLVKAVQDFDPYKGVRLTTYGVWWIRSFMQDAILKNYSLVKIGTTQAQKKLFYRLKREQQRLAQQGIGREQSVKLLASHFDVREKDVREMSQRMSGADVSLNAPTSLDDRQVPIDRLVDDSERADDLLGEAEQKQKFMKILKEFGATLEGREKAVFGERLVSETPLTLKELGARYGVSKERARQIEQAIKEKLRLYVKEHYPDYDILVGSD